MWKDSIQKMIESSTTVHGLDFTSFYSCSRSLISNYGVVSFTDDFNASYALENTASYNATPYTLLCIINGDMLFGWNKCYHQSHSKMLI